MDWQHTNTADLAKAITEFEAALPGWWWSCGACSVSRHASCGPDLNSQDKALLVMTVFDDGFHRDDREGTLADALRAVMRDGVAAKASASPAAVAPPTPPTALSGDPGGSGGGVDMPDVATDPRDCEVLDNVTACVDADGWLIVMCAGETVGVSPAATLRLRDKLNACFPVGK